MEMTLEAEVSETQKGVPPHPTSKSKACHELSAALNGPDIGEIVAKTKG